MIDVSLTVSPIFSSDGRVIGASTIARDIALAKRAREQQKLLLAEIMHRVKNTLATVQAIASQTLCHSPNEERGAFMARLHALSKAHDLLITDQWDCAPLTAVIEAAIKPFQRDRFRLEGPEVGLNASTSLHISLALHELATNAAKYGALSNRTGRIHVRWKPMGSDHLMLAWQEQHGPPVAPPNRKGFGSILIEHAFESVRFRYAPRGFIARSMHHFAQRNRKRMPNATVEAVAQRRPLANLASAGVAIAGNHDRLRAPYGLGRSGFGRASRFGRCAFSGQTCPV